MCSIFGIIDFENRWDTGTIFPPSASGRRSVYITNHALLLHSHDTNNRVASMTLAFCGNLYTAIYSGRIYNADALRTELSALGARFGCGGTAEILIYSYIMFGKDCVEKLNGSFVFSIYDEKYQRLFLVQSPEAEKGFYYTICDTAFLFSGNRQRLESYVTTCKRHKPCPIKRLEQGMGLFFDRTGINLQKG